MVFFDGLDIAKEITTPTGRSLPLRKAAASIAWRTIDNSAPRLSPTGSPITSENKAFGCVFHNAIGRAKMAAR
jgi:hypothetical protein